MLKTSLGVLLAAACFVAAPALAAQARGFIGHPVYDGTGALVGEAHDLIVDVNASRVLYVIIEARGRYHTLPIRALDDQRRLKMELSGEIARGQSLEETRFRRAAWLLGRPISQAGGAQIGTISDIRFDPHSGQIEHVLVETVAGAREMPASVLVQRQAPAGAAARGGAPEQDASPGFVVKPSPERRRLQDPDWK